MASITQTEQDPITAIRSRLRTARDAYAETLANPSLRRAQLAFGVTLAADWGFTVALAVVAFRAGGAFAVGLVTALCVIPSAVLVPLCAALADRFPRERVLVAAMLVSAAATAGVGAAVMLGVALPWIGALAVVVRAALGAVRPAHSALLPALCTTPRQLTSAAIVRGMMDSIGTLVGPALAAVGLALAGPPVVFAVVALTALAAASLFARVRYEAPPRVAVQRRHLAREVLDGFGALAQHRDVTVVVGIGVVQTFTRGCLGVLTVVMAIDLLHNGEAGVGILTTAVGAGAVVGSLGAVLLAGSTALARWEGVGVALWGLPLVACAAFPSEPEVFAFLAAIGVGNALVDVGLFSLPSRLVPDEVVARVFGTFEALVALSIALGALTAPLLVDALGIRWALLAIGAIAPLCIAALWGRLSRIDTEIARRDERIQMLQRVPMLKPLGLATIERIATRLEPIVVGAGAHVFDERDAGDRFYVIESGTAEVRREGRSVRDLSPGDAFGEIALVRDRPRTATVRATGELVLRSVRRDDFLLAVNGYRAAAAEADARVSALLDADALRS